MATLDNFYYDHQLKKYLIQFMSIFAGMQVEVGRNENNEPRLVPVQIHGTSKDRVVAAIKSENTQNKPIRLPVMSAWISNISLAPDMRKGVPNTRRNSYVPTGGLVPDDITVIEQRMPVPYRITFELNLWTSNLDQQNQIVEQILMLFNPILQIQTSDDVFDWMRITQVELTGVALEENVPAGADRRITRTSMTFDVPIWISVPSKIHNKYVQTIYQRVGVVSDQLNNTDVVSAFDDQGLGYTLVVSGDSVTIE